MPANLAPTSSAPAEGPGRSFAVVLTWPKIKNAEYEVVQRMARAATNIGATLHVLDNDGFPLWNNQGTPPVPDRRLTRDECAFAISLHFESPRLYDIPSYSALWNPSEFFVSFGYERTIAQLVSHNDVLSCHSDVSDAQGLGAFAGLGRPLPTPLPALFHSVPGPCLPPRIDAQSRLFYVGINWERISGSKGRHHALLEQLDAEDLIHIYGPDLFLGTRPWEGFANYRGSIPFDGHSVVSRINEAGICLAFSSAAHQSSGIMSNRLFEGLAAGAVIIANPHPFIDKYFADCVHVVDDQRPSAELNAQIRDLVLHIRTNPAEARERAIKGQRRFQDSFALEACLQAILDGHEGRQAAVEAQARGTARHEVSVILNYAGPDAAVLERLLDEVAGQAGVAVDLLVVCDAALETACLTGWGIRGAIRSIRTFSGAFYAALPRPEEEPGKRLRASGKLFGQALSSIGTPFFCVIGADDHWFSDHVATLAHALDQTPGTGFSCSGKILDLPEQEAADTEKAGDGTKAGEGQEDPLESRPKRRLESLTFDQFEAVVDVHHQRDAGRFLYRSSLIPALPHSVFALLDGAETQLLTLWALLGGQPAQTCYATYVQLATVTKELHAPFFTAEEQAHAIRDTVRGNRRWMELASLLRKDRSVTGGGGRVHVETLEAGRMYDVRSKGEGLRYLHEGFSEPEKTATWLLGRSCLLGLRLKSEETPGPMDLVLSARGRRANKDGAKQVCTVVVGGQIVGRFKLSDSLCEYRIAIPEAIDLEGDTWVALRLRHADPVKDKNGAMQDKRRLGMQLAAFGVMPAQPPLSVDRLYGLGEGGEGRVFMEEGLSSPEPGFAWVDGDAAAFRFRMPGGAAPLDLVVLAAGRPARDGTPQRCTVSVNDQVLAQWPVGEAEERLSVRMPPQDGLGSPEVRVTVQLHHAEQPLHADGTVADPRYLGLRLSGFGLFQAPAPPVRRPTVAGRIRRRLASA